MLLIFALFFWFTILLNAITTIPFVIGLLVVSTVIFKKSWIFFAAFFVGLFLDLILIRPLGYTSLVFTIFVFLIWLYERKFETQTATFVFIASFLGSLVYLWIFNDEQILIQSILNSLFAILLFKVSYFGKLRKLSEPD